MERAVRFGDDNFCSVLPSFEEISQENSSVEEDKIVSKWSAEEVGNLVEFV